MGDAGVKGGAVVGPAEGVWVALPLALSIVVTFTEGELEDEGNSELVGDGVLEGDGVLVGRVVTLGVDVLAGPLVWLGLCVVEGSDVTVGDGEGALLVVG